jgi:hypothetical protein
MEQIARPEGFMVIFRFLRYAQFMPYIAIGLLLAAVAIWIVFGKKKFKWAKILAIILTVLVVIAGVLSFTPQIMSAVTCRDIPMGGPGQMNFPTGDGEKFKDFRDRENKENGDQQFRDFREREENENSSLDIDIYQNSIDLQNIIIAV